MDSDSKLLDRELELENQLLKGKMEEHRNNITNLQYNIESLKNDNKKKQKEIDELSRELLSVKSGRAYKFAQKVKKIIK